MPSLFTESSDENMDQKAGQENGKTTSKRVESTFSDVIGSHQGNGKNAKTQRDTTDHVHLSSLLFLAVGQGITAEAKIRLKPFPCCP